ncbi:nitroreductase family protein [Anaeromicropila populeti]|uniref:Nitroreductase n=1 Tax=Anaeromicropila populeti TaxID=37658 RepID=A0A1I6HJI5_9FIRM|nr:nitroreductase family protein [Anaeromicropila populeti]SFR54467.1 Nitroreductase [Anaeromicropila populeti]
MFYVNEEKCIGCGVCVSDCPLQLITIAENKKASIINETCMKCGHCLAVCPSEAISTDDYDMNEVKTYHEEDFSISPEHLLDFIKSRRSVRHFKNQPVEKEKLEKIIEAGRFTASGTNSQDVSYTVITDKLAEIKDMAYAGLLQKSDYIYATTTEDNDGARRYADMLSKFYQAYKNDPEHNDPLFNHAPAAIIVTASNPVNAALASSNMELMIHACGLGGFFNGFFVFATEGNPALLNTLNIPTGKFIITCLMVGYKDVDYLRTVPRKAADITWL